MTKLLTRESTGVAVVGTGFIGPVHVEALYRNGIRVVGILASSPEAGQQKASELGIPKAYDTYQDLLDDPSVNVVHLTTPNYLHFEQAKAALLAGKHVVCEKPLAMTSKESKLLVDLAKEKNLVNAVNFNIRMYPMAQQARSMVQAGDIGDLLITQGSYLQDWLLLPTDWNWRLETSLGGSLRAVADIGSHWLDLVSYICGLKIVEVFADFKTFHPVRKKPKNTVETFTGKLVTADDLEDVPVTTEDYATILLHWENGAHGVLTVAQVCSGRKNRLFFELNGTKSSLAWDGERPNELWIGNRHSPNQLLLKDPSLMSQEARAVISYPGGHNEGFPDTFKQLYKKIYDYIYAGDTSLPAGFPTFEDGHYEMLVCEAIESSAREKTWIRI